MIIISFLNHASGRGAYMHFL